MTDYRRLTNEYMKQELRNKVSHEVTEDDLLAAGRKELIALCKKHEVFETDEDLFVPVEPAPDIPIPDVPDSLPTEPEPEPHDSENECCRPIDIGWHQHVMSQFDEDELIDGNPTVFGLRRMVEKIFGVIVDSGPIEVKTIDSNSTSPYVTVTYRVSILAGIGGEKTLLTQREVASVWMNTDDKGCAEGNVQPEFAKYAEATASTRAEGRCLRKMLKLRNVLADGEFCSDESMAGRSSVLDAIAKTAEYDADEKIKTNQMNFIDSKCRQLDINVTSFINSGTDQYNSISDVTDGTAAAMVAALTEYQTEVGTIPPEILGYDENWRT